MALSAAGWLRGGAPVGLTPGGVLALCRLLLPWGDGPLAARFAAYPGLVRGFVEPLAVAALNTPLSEASSALFAAVLRRVLLPGRGGCWWRAAGLGRIWWRPPWRRWRRAGCACSAACGSRRSRCRGRAAVLRFAGAEEVRLGRGERVLLALPPWEAARLLPGTPAPAEFSPILNLHFARPAETPLRFLGLMGGLGQWVLLRPAGIAVTISAADAALALPTDTLARRVWAEVRRLATAFALPGPGPTSRRPERVAERRATPRHRPGARRLPPRLPLPNLAFAGDWTDPVLPATLEAAVRSGEDAAMALLRSVP